MNTKNKGTLTEAKCLAYLASISDEVLVPFGDRMPFDLVYIRDNLFYKVQCKYSSVKTASEAYEVNLRVSGGNKSRTTNKLYSPNDFDYLYIETLEDSYFIPWNLINGITKITVSKNNKYSKYIIT